MPLVLLSQHLDFDKLKVEITRDGQVFYLNEKGAKANGSFFKFGCNGKKEYKVKITDGKTQNNVIFYYPNGNIYSIVKYNDSLFTKSLNYLDSLNCKKVIKRIGHTSIDTIDVFITRRDSLYDSYIVNKNANTKLLVCADCNYSVSSDTLLFIRQPNPINANKFIYLLPNQRFNLPSIKEKHFNKNYLKLSFLSEKNTGKMMWSYQLDNNNELFIIDSVCDEYELYKVVSIRNILK